MNLEIVVATKFDGAAGIVTSAFTVNWNEVVCDIIPDVPVTVIVAVPTVADDDAVNVNVVEQAGLHDVGENVAVTPEGNPDTEYDTDCVVPLTRLAVIVFVIEYPCVTALFPEFKREKSKPDCVVADAVLLYAESPPPAL